MQNNEERKQEVKFSLHADKETKKMTLFNENNNEKAAQLSKKPQEKSIC